MKLENKKITIQKYSVSLFFVLVMTLVPTFALLRFQIKQDILNDSISNFRIYLVTAAVFLLMLIASISFSIFFLKEVTISRWWYLGYIFLGAINVVLLAKCYTNSVTIYPYLSGEWFPWHVKEQWKVFSLMAGVSTVGVVSFFYFAKQSRLIEMVRYPLYILASGVAGASMYASNFFAGDVMHGNAYYTSIYNALMDAPYDYSNQSIYGHYAIFLKYPIKLLGGNYTANNIVISMVGALSVLFVALTLDLCVKNHFISIIGTWSIPVMYLYYPRNHWQMFPHRVFFAGIMLYLMALYFYRKKRWIKVIGYIVSGLSILWNVETGIVCLGVWALACILYENAYEAQLIGIKAVTKCIWKNVVHSVLIIMGMLLLFNLYNMSLGEEWHGLRFLLFPLDSGWDMPRVLVAQAQEYTDNVIAEGVRRLWNRINNGFASGLSIQLPYQVSPWYFVFLLMGIAVIVLVVRMLYKRAEENDFIMGLAAILALGQLIYFFNRPCFDYLAIGLFESVLIMAILIEEKTDKKTVAIKRPYQILFISILSVLSVLSLWQTYFRFSGRMENGYYDRTNFDQVIGEISQAVPENTFAFGQGIQEIYAQLGWDTGCYIVDYSTLGHTDSIGRIIVESSKQNECVISVRSKRSEEEVTAKQFMGYWGYVPEAINIKRSWKLDVDKNNYWSIYYLEIDQSKGNELVEIYEKQVR